MKYIKSTIISLLFLVNNTYANIDDYLKSILNQPDKLYTFFKDMPKGGELHYHFTGSAYPEELIAISKKNNFYLHPQTYTISNKFYPDYISTKIFFREEKNYEPTIRAWSMKNLITDYKTRYEHFFGVFNKIRPIYNTHYQLLLAKVLTRAANQNTMYMEIILKPFEYAKDFQSLLKTHESLHIKKAILLDNPDFNKKVAMFIADGDRYLQDTYNYLQCTRNKEQAACKVVVRLQAYVLRETEIDVFFAQALAAFIAADKSKNIVGVNIVQPENGKLALQDFTKQMQIFNFLHKEFPNVNISMHAGELDPKTNNLDILSNHINDSIFIAHAQRIGHGVDIRYEKYTSHLIKYMAKHHRLLIKRLERYA